jgi:hypothetical protein
MNFPVRQRLSAFPRLARGRSGTGAGGLLGMRSRPSRFPTKSGRPQPFLQGVPSPSSKGLGPADSPPRSGLQRGGDLPEQLGES